MKEFEITNFKTNQYYFSNFFNIYKEDSGEKFYNINRTLFFKGLEDISPSFYNEYTSQISDTWPGISFNFFGTIELDWLIMKINNITNPILDIEEGVKLKIPTKEFIQSILNQIYEK